MQERSFTKNYILIYIFQALSIILGFASLLVVVPSLSSNKEMYGIYSVCTSITIFLSYADLGFLGAGTKYAAENYARGEKEEELKIVGFSHFMLLCVVLLISAFFLVLSFRPDLLIANIGHGEEYHVAKSLLLILALCSPTVVLQRMIQMIFSVRLQEYKMQRFAIIGNIVKILSVLYFFGNGRYDIVGYYLTTYIINIVVILIGFIQIKCYFGYSFIDIIQHLKFNKTVFDRIKKLAMSTLFVTLTWVVYYEFDSIVIGKFLGAEAVATYAIGLTLIGFIRSILAVFFGPFAARFNHFVALHQNEELRRFYVTIITVMFPIAVFPILSIAIMCKPIIFSWVGVQYVESVKSATLLVLCNVLGFIAYPAGNLIVAQENLKVLYWLNGMMPIVFWCGVLILTPFIGVDAFALFKFVVFMLSGLCYLKYSLVFININFGVFIKTFVVPYLPALAVIIVFLSSVRNIFSIDKNMLYLIYNAGFIFTALILAFGTSYLFVKPLRIYVNSALSKILRS